MLGGQSPNQVGLHKADRRLTDDLNHSSEHEFDVFGRCESELLKRLNVHLALSANNRSKHFVRQ